MTKKLNEWSERSQQSILWEDELQRQLGQTERLIDGQKNEIADLERRKAELARDTTKPRGNPMAGEWLKATIERLKVARETVATYEKQREELQAEIGKLTPNPSQLEARANQQGILARQIAQRLENDREIDRALDDLRQLLGKRAKLTAGMSECASAIEFSTTNDRLDARRYDALRASLPVAMAVESECCADRILGKPKDAKTYVVRDELLVVRENLASNGVHHQGDRIQLTDEDACELLRDDRPDPRPVSGYYGPWSRKPASVVSLEQYEADVAAAKERNISVEALWAYEDLEQLRGAKEEYLAHGPQHSR